MIFYNAGCRLKHFYQCVLTQYLAPLCFYPCVGSWWYIFPKFFEVVCLPLLTPGVLNIACHLEFPIFRRQTIVAFLIESTDFVIFFVLNDFLDVAKSHFNTFFFKVLVAFFCLMNGLCIILIIKARRIRTEPYRLDDTFQEQRLSISNNPLVRSWEK